MIWEAVPDDAFEATWRARAAHLAQGPNRGAFKRIKAPPPPAMQASFGNGPAGASLLLEGQLQGAMRPDAGFFKEGVVAFLEKRKNRCSRGGRRGDPGGSAPHRRPSAVSPPELYRSR